MFQKRKIYIGYSNEDERPCYLIVTSVKEGKVHGYLTLWAYGDKDTLVEHIKADIESWEGGGEYICIPLKDSDWFVDSDNSI